MDPLFEETRLKSLHLPNRLMRSATWMAMAAPDGSSTEPLLACYDTLARGGLGMIITGFAYVAREGQGPEGQLGIYSDHLVDGLRRLVELVHAQGGPLHVLLLVLDDLPELGLGDEALLQEDHADEPRFLRLLLDLEAFIELLLRDHPLAKGDLAEQHVLF